MRFRRITTYTSSCGAPCSLSMALSQLKLAAAITESTPFFSHGHGSLLQYGRGLVGSLCLHPGKVLQTERGLLSIKIYWMVINQLASSTPSSVYCLLILAANWLTLYPINVYHFSALCLFLYLCVCLRSPEGKMLQRISILWGRKGQHIATRSALRVILSWCLHALCFFFSFILPCMHTLGPGGALLYLCIKPHDTSCAIWGFFPAGWLPGKTVHPKGCQ